MAKVLILDQSKSIRNTLRERLEFEGIAAESAENEAAASVLCERIPFDLIISDHETRLPESDVPFIVLSSEATVDSAIKALRNGAQDYLTKPIDMNRLMQSIRQTLEQAAEAPRTAAKAKAKRSSAGHTEEIIGTSEQMQHVRRLIDKVAPCDARVLITGENGTGKELVARWLHAKSNRAGAPFVEVNCAAIPSELIESELFGHERGAFTSAIKQRKGKFEQASGGTLFMDEIGDMSLAAQAKVRALQERKISRVGSDKDVDVDVRIIAATNKNLREEIKKGNFREDLFHRIGVILIKVPPLREHSEDIPLLVDHFIDMICEEYGQHPRTAQRHRAARGPERHQNHTERRRTLLLNISEQLENLTGAVHYVVCPVFIQLRPVAEAPSHTDRPDRIHIDARIPGVQHRSGFRIRIGENLPHHLRIGFERDSGALTENRIETDRREIDPHQLLGTDLKFVGSDSQPDSTLHQLPEQFRNTLVGTCKTVDMFGIVSHEIRTHRRHRFRRAQLLGQRPFDQPHNAVADKTAILLIGMQGQSPRSQHMIAASRQIADRIEQRPVQVENHQFRIHIKSLNYK